MEHLLKLALAQSTATIGSVMRAWLRVMAFTATIMFAVSFVTLQPDHGAVQATISAIPFCIIAGGLLSIPVMIVLAIIYIVRKW